MGVSMMGVNMVGVSMMSSMMGVSMMGMGMMSSMMGVSMMSMVVVVMSMICSFFSSRVSRGVRPVRLCNAKRPPLCLLISWPPLYLLMIFTIYGQAQKAPHPDNSPVEIILLYVDREG
ncbi:unnamed protein product [Calypogeia fissa]